MADGRRVPWQRHAEGRAAGAGGWSWRRATTSCAPPRPPALLRGSRRTRPTGSPRTAWADPAGPCGTPPSPARRSAACLQRRTPPMQPIRRPLRPSCAALSWPRSLRWLGAISGTMRISQVGSRLLPRFANATTSSVYKMRLSCKVHATSAEFLQSSHCTSMPIWIISTVMVDVPHGGSRFSFNCSPNQPSGITASTSRRASGSPLG